MKHSINAVTIAMALTGAISLVQPATASAQRTARRLTAAPDARRHSAADRTMGVMFGAYTLASPGISITGEDMQREFNTNFGPGAGLMVGYGFNPTFSAYAALDLAKQGSGIDGITGSFGLAHFEAGVRANVPTNSPNTVPYVSAAIGARAVGARVEDFEWGEEYDLSFSGTMFALGGGVQHFISHNLALDGGVTLGLGKMGHLDDDGEKETLSVNNSTSIRMRFGLTWRP
jgi:hypothetical protein